MFFNLYKIRNFFTFGKILIIILIIGIGVGTYFIFFKTKETTKTITVKSVVKIGDIQDSISVIGTANLIDEQKIQFNQNGQVALVHFKEGDNVKKGNIIVELDKKDLLNSIKQSEIDLNNAKIKLAQDLKPVEKKDILNAENNILKSQNDLINAEANLINLQKEQDNKIFDLQNQINAQESEIKSKENQLQLTKNEFKLLIEQEEKNLSNTNIDIQKTINTAFTDLRKYIINAQNYLNSIDEVFGFTDFNKSKSLDYILYISAKNTNLKNQTEQNWHKTNNLYIQNNSYYNSISNSGITNEDIIKLTSGILDLYDNLIILSKNASDAIKSSITSSNYSQSNMDSHYSTMSQILNQAQSGFDQIRTTLINLQKITDPDFLKQQSESAINKQKLNINDLENNLQKLKNALIVLNNNLEFTKKTYENQLNQQNLNLKSIQNTLEINKENLNYIQRGATPEQISLSKNSIAKQEIALSQAKDQIKKYQIEAPFDGIIKQIDFKIGDNLSTQDNTKYIYLNNPNIIELTSELDQTDIGKVKIGQQATMVFDTFQNISFTGVINKIDSSPVITSGVTSYKIKISFDKGKYDIYTGMTAKINILIKSASDKLIIPTAFLQKNKNKNYVLLDNNTKEGKKIEIKTGLSNSVVTEIIDGLKEGDIVLRNITISSNTGTGSNNSNQRSGGMFPGGGSGGGGAGRMFNH